MKLAYILFSIFYFSLHSFCSDNLEEEDGTELYYHTRLSEKESHIEYLYQKYFDLNKKRIEEEKDLNSKLEEKTKRVVVKNKKLRTVSHERDKIANKLSEKEEEISSLLTTKNNQERLIDALRDENAQLLEITNERKKQHESQKYEQYYEKLLIDFIEVKLKHDQLEKELTTVNQLYTSVNSILSEGQEVVKRLTSEKKILQETENQRQKEIEDLKVQLDLFHQKYHEESLVLTHLRDKVAPYEEYKLFFNPQRRQAHKLIPNDKLAEEKWLLTPYQTYIITHMVDNGTTILSEKT